MFDKKKKQSYFQKVRDEYDEYFNAENIKEYNEIKDTYKFIKESYEEKIKNNEIEINMEEIRLKKHLTYKDFNKYNPKDFMLSLSLKVLKDIEEEQKTSIIKISSEVAAVLAEDDKNVKKDEEPKSYVNESNVNINISGSDLMQVGKGVYKLVKFAKKKFKRK